MSTEFHLYLQAASSLMLCGLIWTIQILHYPLFASVGSDAFPAYETKHQQRISWIVIPLMLLELMVATRLLISPDTPVGLQGSLWLGMGLLIIIWGATFLLSVPAHKILAEGFDPNAHRKLVSTNWIRTVGWSLRGLLSIWIIHQFHTL